MLFRLVVGVAVFNCSLIQALILMKHFRRPTRAMTSPAILYFCMFNDACLSTGCLLLIEIEA